MSENEYIGYKWIMSEMRNIMKVNKDEEIIKVIEEKKEIEKGGIEWERKKEKEKIMKRRNGEREVIDKEIEEKIMKKDIIEIEVENGKIKRRRIRKVKEIMRKGKSGDEVLKSENIIEKGGNLKNDKLWNEIEEKKKENEERKREDGKGLVDKKKDENGEEWKEKKEVRKIKSEMEKGKEKNMEMKSVNENIEDLEKIGLIEDWMREKIEGWDISINVKDEKGNGREWIGMLLRKEKKKWNENEKKKDIGKEKERKWYNKKNVGGGGNEKRERKIEDEIIKKIEKINKSIEKGKRGMNKIGRYK